MTGATSTTKSRLGPDMIQTNPDFKYFETFSHTKGGTRISEAAEAARIFAFNTSHALSASLTFMF
jgi:hypothetical protein